MHSQFSILPRCQPQIAAAPPGLDGMLQHLPALRVAPGLPTMWLYARLGPGNKTTFGADGRRIGARCSLLDLLADPLLRISLLRRSLRDARVLGTCVCGLS